MTTTSLALAQVRDASAATIRAEAKLHQAVRDAVNLGCDITAIATAAGVTRQTVYRWCA